MLTLVRLGAHVSLDMLIERTLVAHRFLANRTDIGIVLALVDLLVALEAVVGGKGGSAITLELLQTAV